MISLINGVEKQTLNLFRQADSDLINVMLLDDNGVQLDITGDAITLELYANEDRRAAPVSTFTGTVATALAGLATFTITNVLMTTPVGTYYGFIKRVENVGSTVEWGNKSFEVKVK